MRTPSSMISVVLAVIALMVIGMVAATFGGLWMIERVLSDPADAVPSVLSSILLMAIPLLLITAAGVAACIWVFRRFRRGNDALLRTGIAGTATVLSLRDTGTTINRVHAVVELGLLVAIPGRAPYQARAETMVARMNWGSVQPGMQLSVRVDPADATRIAIDWNGGAGAPAMAGAAMGAAGARQAFQVAAVRSAADIVARGQPADAIIQSMAHTGATVAQMAPAGSYAPDMADDPMVRITLRVEPPGGAPFVTDGMFRVPRAKLGMLTLGGRVPVAVISGERNSATIDWARL
ncbi:MAG: hypothetical protein AB7O88_19760 [Reyranellaceae bacterium]